MIYDVITYNGEQELLDLRFNVLYPHVDKFIIVEFDETFSGKKKAKLLIRDWQDSWTQFLNKIDYVHISKEEYNKYGELADLSPNVPLTPKHWKREFCQKESIKDALLELNDNDQVFIGDCDEIWDISAKDLSPSKLKLKVYSYYLNNRSNEEFWGPIVAQYKDIKDNSLNYLRTGALARTEQEYGWHFTSMGGPENVKRKLTDSYTNDSYASPYVIDNLQDNINNNKDFLGRHFSYTINESEWPQYLKDNKDKYKHLLK